MTSTAIVDPAAPTGEGGPGAGQAKTAIVDPAVAAEQQQPPDVERDGAGRPPPNDDDASVSIASNGGGAEGEDDEDDGQSETKWRLSVTDPSLPEMFNSVAVVEDPNASGLRKLSGYLGVGCMIGVGYMDPGNWATDIAAGANYGYDLLFVILLASCMAMLLQHLSLKLGITTGRDLAQACRDSFHPVVVVLLWIVFEIAMMATDVAEMLGAAIALYLLTGLPLWAGVVITMVDVVLVLMLNTKIRRVELFVAALTLVILVCMSTLIGWTKPNWGSVFRGMLPTSLHQDREIYVAIGIMGAVVMPHNLFLHSSIIQTRKYSRTAKGKRSAITFGTIDVTVTLFLAFIVNSFILVVAAAALYKTGAEDVFDAYRYLADVLQSMAPAHLFAVGLLASGIQSSITGTLAGQIVMEGMIKVRVTPWKRRLITRGIAMIPAVVITAVMQEDSTKVLVFSQVILSMTLPFAVIPLVYFTSSRMKMGPRFVNGLCLKVFGGMVCLVICSLNIYVLTLPSTWEF